MLALISTIPHAHDISLFPFPNSFVLLIIIIAYHRSQTKREKRRDQYRNTSELFITKLIRNKIAMAATLIMNYSWLVFPVTLFIIIFFVYYQNDFLLLLPTINLPPPTNNLKTLEAAAPAPLSSSVGHTIIKVCPF